MFSVLCSGCRNVWVMCVVVVVLLVLVRVVIRVLLIMILLVFIVIVVVLVVFLMLKLVIIGMWECWCRLCRWVLVVLLFRWLDVLVMSVKLM